MKYLLYVFALAAPCVSMAAVVSASASQPQAEVADSPVDPARHRPLLNVKFVLVKAPPEQHEGPNLDFGNGQPAIVPLPLSDWGSVPLRAGYTNPNAYWCGDLACIVGPN